MWSQRQPISRLPSPWEAHGIIDAWRKSLLSTVKCPGAHSSLDGYPVVSKLSALLRLQIPIGKYSRTYESTSRKKHDPVPDHIAFSPCALVQPTKSTFSFNTDARQRSRAACLPLFQSETLHALCSSLETAPFPPFEAKKRPRKPPRVLRRRTSGRCARPFPCCAPPTATLSALR